MLLKKNRSMVAWPFGCALVQPHLFPNSTLSLEPALAVSQVLVGILRVSPGCLIACLCSLGFRGLCVCVVCVYFDGVLLAFFGRLSEWIFKARTRAVIMRYIFSGTQSRFLHAQHGRLDPYDDAESARASDAGRSAEGLPAFSLLFCNTELRHKLRVRPLGCCDFGPSQS